MVARVWAVRSLSLSRIGLALLFVLCFQRQLILLYVSLGLCLAAAVTDLLDGYLARRLSVASVQGRLWDSLGDKSFYVAVIIAFNAQGFLGPLISWALIVREVALYITRILFIHNLPEIERIRPLTNWHGYFMYLMTVTGCAQMYAELNDLGVRFGPYVIFSACGALVFGVASVFYFMGLREPL
jgi:phosphatidylglycerophosphate synthase